MKRPAAWQGAALIVLSFLGCSYKPKTQDYDAREVGGKGPSGNGDIEHAGGIETADEQSKKTVDYRRKFALFVGIDEYDHMGDLRYASRDASEILQVLQRDYGFRRDRCLLLMNGDSRKETIRLSFSSWLRSCNPGMLDCVVVYLSGHGSMRGGEFFFAACDSAQGEVGDWIPFSYIVEQLVSLNTNCALIVDCCFSGNLFKPVQTEVDQKTLGGQMPAFVAISSGRDSPVSESNRGGEGFSGDGRRVSPFAQVLIEELERKAEPSWKGAVVPFSELAVRVTTGFETRLRARQEGIDLAVVGGVQRPDWGTIGNMSSRFFFQRANATLGPRESLVYLIIDCVRPEAWDAQGGSGSIEVLGPTLMVHTTAGVHEVLYQFLTRLRRECGLEVVAAPAAPSWVELYNGLLDQPVSVDSLEDGRLLSVVQALAGRVAGCEIELDSVRLEEAGVGEYTPVVLQVGKRPLREILHELLDPLELVFIVGERGIDITTKDQLEEETHTRVYNVRDLLSVMQGESRADVLAQFQEVGRRWSAEQTLPGVQKATVNEGEIVALLRKQGSLAYERESFESAIFFFGRITERYPRLARADDFYMRGECHVGRAFRTCFPTGPWREELREAIAGFSQFLSRTRHPQVLVRRADTYVDLEEYGKAISDFEQAIEIRPEGDTAWKTHLKCADAYVSLAQFERALGHTIEAAQKTADNRVKYTAYCARGYCYEQLGRVLGDGAQIRKAFDAYQEAVDLEPSLWHAHSSIAWLYSTLPEKLITVEMGRIAVAHGERAFGVNIKDDSQGLPFKSYARRPDKSYAAALSSVGDFEAAKRVFEEPVTLFGERVQPENEGWKLLDSIMERKRFIFVPSTLLDEDTPNDKD